MATRKIAVLRTELTEGDEEQIRQLFPGEDVEFVMIAPESPDQTIEMLEQLGPFEFTVLRPATLVEKALGQGHRFVLQDRYGTWTELVAAPVITRAIGRPGSSGSLGY